jgi:ABC-type multidrug transport system permease subunit
MNGVRKNILVLVCGALLIGVLFRSFVILPALVIITLGLVSVFVLLILSRKSVGVILVFVILGFGWHSFVATDMCSNSLDSFEGKEFVIEGVVTSEPVVSGVRRSFELAPEEIGLVFRGEEVSLCLFLQN